MAILKLGSEPPEQILESHHWCGQAHDISASSVQMTMMDDGWWDIQVTTLAHFDSGELTKSRPPTVIGTAT